MNRCVSCKENVLAMNINVLPNMAANIPTTTYHEQIGIQSPQALADWNPSRWSGSRADWNPIAAGTR